ncbi:MAG: hypothetical protein ACI92G_004256, partial [Candidatus Pelagisphaera sp.]
SALQSRPATPLHATAASEQTKEPFFIEEP